MAEIPGIQVDKVQWHEFWLDTPFARPGGNSAEEAMSIPGNCVKSKLLEDNLNKISGHPYPKYHGRVTEFSDDRVVLIAHNDGFQDLWFWIGTKEEYFKHWECD